jgi:hypothetical protein
MSARRSLLGKSSLPLVAIALCASTLAAPAPPTPTVDEIVARFVTARGGLNKIRAIRTLRQSGHVWAGADRKALVTRELARPTRVRFEFTVQGVTAVYVSDGQHGWRVSPLDGVLEPEPLSGEVVAEAAEQGDIEGPLVDWKAKGHQLELVGRETVGEHETYKLKLTLSSGAVRHEYIDVNTSHLIRTDSTRQVRGRALQLTTTFGEHKKFGGVLFPRLIEVEAAGRPQPLRIVLDKIEVNPPLSVARFELAAPAGP